MVRILSARFSLELTTLFPLRQPYSLLLDRCPSSEHPASSILKTSERLEESAREKAFINVEIAC